MQNKCPGINTSIQSGMIIQHTIPLSVGILGCQSNSFDTVMSHALAPQASINRASPHGEIGAAVGNAGLTRGWGSFSSLATRLDVGPTRLLLPGHTRGTTPLHSSLRIRETEPETQGAVPPVPRVRPGQGLALSHRDQDVEVLWALPLGCPGQGPTGYMGVGRWGLSSSLAGLGSSSLLAIRLAVGPVKPLLTGRTGGTVVPSLLLRD